MALKDLISINDLTTTEIRKIFTAAADMKANPRNYSDALAGGSVALIFEKPSLRTRVTFDLGATQMGASCVYLDHQNVRLGERESVKDMALNLARAGSRVRVAVEPTNEEWIAASHASRLLRGAVVLGAC